jgi:AraC-like DNA-binding protein
MKNMLIHAAAIALSAFLISCGGGESRPGSFVDLSGTWTLVPSDTGNPADPDYDDARAKKIEIPGEWGGFLRGSGELASTVWLRKKVVIGPGLSDRMLVLYLGTIAISDETYFNGAFIGATGVMPPPGRPLDYDFSLHRERNYRFPASLVRRDGENVIAIRIFSHYISGMKDRPALMTNAAWNERNWFRDLFPSFNNFNAVILSGLLLVILAVVVKGTGGRLIALFSFVFILSVLSINIVMLGLPRFENNLFRFKWFFGMYVFVDYVLLLLLQEFFNIRNRAAIMVSTAILAGVASFVVFAPTTSYLESYCMPAAIGAIILYILYSTGLFLVALRRDPRRYWYLSIVAVFVLASVANTLYLIVTGQMYRMSLSFSLRLPALLLGAMFVYLVDLRSARGERDSMARALLKKTKELQRAAKILTKTNVRPEPKDIIHQVIEYLDNNFNETYDRKKLAERFRLNEDYMGQLFKKVTNTNIANYINVKRIEAARQLLKDTDGKVIDIAFHVGFDNLTYFYRHFKKHTGFSPIEYRRRVKGSIAVFDPGDADSEMY